VTVVAVVCHAAQSRHRSPLQILAGDRVTDVWSPAGEGLERCSLRLDKEDRDLYGSLVRVIQAETGPNDSILALPNDAELYFLASRRNPTRFYNGALGMWNDAALNDVLTMLTTRPPRLVAFRPDDKYNNAASQQVMAHVRSAYERFTTVGGLELYRLRSPRDAGTARPRSP
jgi:hypothetical protein